MCKVRGIRKMSLHCMVLFHNSEPVNHQKQHRFAAAALKKTVSANRSRPYTVYACNPISKPRAPFPSFTQFEMYGFSKMYEALRYVSLGNETFQIIQRFLMNLFSAWSTAGLFRSSFFPFLFSIPSLKPALLWAKPTGKSTNSSFPVVLLGVGGFIKIKRFYFLAHLL